MGVLWMKCVVWCDQLMSRIHHRAALNHESKAKANETLSEGWLKMLDFDERNLRAALVLQSKRDYIRKILERDREKERWWRDD